MTIRTLIFDLDGTLLDTLADLADAVNQALAANGLRQLPADDYRMLVGAGARNLVTRAAASAAGIRPEQVTPELTDRLLAAFNRAYALNWADRTQPYPGVMDLLDALTAAGFALAILSNKPDEFTRQAIGHFFPADTFSAVFGKLDGWPIKPDPALALETCRLLGADPSDTALIGDSGSDMATAVNAGLLPIGVLWGFRDREELLAGGARHLASTTHDLYNILTGGELM